MTRLIGYSPHARAPQTNPTPKLIVSYFFTKMTIILIITVELIMIQKNLENMKIVKDWFHLKILGEIFKIAEIWVIVSSH